MKYLIFTCLCLASFFVGYQLVSILNSKVVPKSEVFVLRACTSVNCTRLLTFSIMKDCALIADIQAIRDPYVHYFCCSESGCF